MIRGSVANRIKEIVQSVNGLFGNITLTSSGGTVTITTPTADTINLESSGGGGSVTSVNGQTGVVVLDTGDIASVVDSRYVTDAQLVVIGNTSGTNTGDVTVTDSSEIDFTLTGQNITASLIAGSIDETKLDASVNVSLDLADTALQVNQTITLSGDITGSGATSITTTLATVNSNVGSFGSATQVAQVTLDGKGRATAASNVSIQIAESQVTNLVSDLAGKQPLDATLTSIAAVSGVQGDLLYASGTDTWTRLAKDANATRYLSNQGTSNNPSWNQVNLANGVTGDLPLANLAPSSAASKLLARGSAAGGGDWQEISIDSTLTMLGTTLGVTVTTPFAMQTDGNSFTTNALYRAADSTGTTAKPTDIIVDNSENISGIGSLQLVSGGALRTGTSAGNTVLLQAYDVDGAAYTTFGTLTANNSPTLNFENTTIGITAPAQGNFGNSTNYASFSSGGNLVFNGTAQYLLNLDQFAFAVNGLPTTGVKFRFFTGVAGYAFTDLAGADIASIDVSGTDSIVNAVYGYAHGVASPASIGSNQNDYAGFAGAGFGRLSSSANYNITGVVAPTNSRPQFKFGCNTGTETINLTSNDTGSTAANRFALANDDTINVYPGEMFIEQYDTTSLKWRAGKLSNITRGHVNALATATYIV